jgi:hypothetical protein
LGASPKVLSARRGFGWLYLGEDTNLPLGGREVGRWIPVFLVMHPAAALRNTFVQRWFEADLAPEPRVTRRSRP